MGDVLLPLSYILPEVKCSRKGVESEASKNICKYCNGIGEGSACSPPPPFPKNSIQEPQEKKASQLDQVGIGSEKGKIFLKIVLSCKVASYKDIHFLSFQNQPYMMERCIKDLRTRRKGRTKNIEISKYFHLISYKYFEIF